jgi:hypothetical protein
MAAADGFERPRSPGGGRGMKQHGFSTKMPNWQLVFNRISTEKDGQIVPSYFIGSRCFWWREEDHRRPSFRPANGSSPPRREGPATFLTGRISQMSQMTRLRQRRERSGAPKDPPGKKTSLQNCIIQILIRPSILRAFKSAVESKQKSTRSNAQHQPSC